jgi:NitT/TauT family transport system permease protein
MGESEQMAEKVYTRRLAPQRVSQRLNLGERLRYYLPTVTVFFAVLFGCELSVRLFDIKQFILPAPSVIVDAFTQHFQQLVDTGRYTATEALGGFVIGCSAGILVALATARWTAARESLMPFAIAANSVPIIAFAPIMNNWFGLTNQFSKMMIVAIITFFPMMINMVRGLTAVEPSALELMRSYATSDLEALLKVRLPNSLPYLFNALKVNSTLALIGAVVGEFFGGPREALGVFITQEAAFFRFDNSWAAIIIAAVLGIAFYVIILFFERLAIPWHASVRGAEE